MPDILHRIVIAAPPEKVFQAITTADGFKGWWTDDVRAEPRVGSVAEFGFFKRETVFRMQIDELEAPIRVRWTCVGGPPEWVGTRIGWRLEPAKDGGTVVRFAHAGWRAIDGDFAPSNTTWGHLMHHLKWHAEGEDWGPHFRSEENEGR